MSRLFFWNLRVGISVRMRWIKKSDGDLHLLISFSFHAKANGLLPITCLKQKSSWEPSMTQGKKQIWGVRVSGLLFDFYWYLSSHSYCQLSTSHSYSHASTNLRFCFNKFLIHNEFSMQGKKFEEIAGRGGWKIGRRDLKKLWGRKLWFNAFAKDLTKAIFSDMIWATLSQFPGTNPPISIKRY